MSDKDFNYWEGLSRAQNLTEFSTNREGLMWLKLKSILRPTMIEKFCSKYGIHLEATQQQKKFMELYELLSGDSESAHIKLDDFFRSESMESSLDVDKLSNELYKVEYFHWGGDQNNSLDKYLVKHYVKDINDYESLLKKFDCEINGVVRDYVLASWYNHWSSILIENIFRGHNKVLIGLGKIRNVDFFISDIPFDLKVTYFPHAYYEEKRRERGWDKKELSFLKRKAKEVGITCDRSANESKQMYAIKEQMVDSGNTEALNIIQCNREAILTAAMTEIGRKELIKWLYENQGEMRFGAENRLFIILIDRYDWENSWKLKRNINLLKPAINGYLDTFNPQLLEKMKITFCYKGQNYSTYSDILFVVKET